MVRPSATDTVLVTIRDSANTPPTADAGANQTVTEGATVSLDGTASDTDAEDTLAYRWTHNSSLTITLADPAALDTTFTAPNVAADTPVLFTLNVSDGTASATDTVLVTIRDSANTPPTADAGANQTVTEGATVSLDGTASDTDAEDTLAYRWTHNSSLTITLADPAALDTTFTAPNVAADTPVLFTLNVSDGTASATDTVLVTIRDSANTPPTADAGANQTVTEGATVSLDGTASDTDAEDTLAYRWTHNSSLTITLADPAALDTTFTAPNVAADTPVLFTLNVSDGTASATDTVLVTIRDSANTPPTADAGANQTVTEGATVSLDGTASDTDAEDTLAYRWTHNSSLTITLADPAALDTSFTAPNVAADTPVLFTLNVSDGTASSTDTVLVTIRDSANTPPTVDAGANQTVTEGATVSLDGTASDTDAEDTLAYRWTHNSSLTITLADPDALDTSFTAPNVAADTPVLFTLNVSDGTASSTDTVLVTIRDSANTPPTADAGANQTVTEGATVSLDGTASDTDTEDTLTYAWTFNNTALGITLADPAALDTSFTAPNVAADTPVLFTLNVTDGAASATDTVLVTIRDSANTPPTADAGANQTVTEGDTVTLSGTASDVDPEDSLTYAWTFNNTALDITLADPAALDTTFTAPNVAADTPVLFTLNVTDGAASSTDTVLVTIRDSANTPPVVNAGSPQTVAEGDTVTLSGTASDVDPEDSLTYAWTFNNTALGITLADPAALDTTFTAPNVAADTPVLFTLNVTDGTASATDTVLVTIRDSANTPPVVNAGSPQTVAEGDTVTLSGTASDVDPEDSLTYAWTFNNTALGITLADPAALDTSFTAPNVAADTPVLFTLNVTDGTASATDTVLVTIRDSANTPPTVDAGASQTVTEGATVSLDGTASDTDTEDTLTYAWTFNNTALGITLADPAALDTTFTAPNVAADTPVLFTLTVSDGTASATDTVLVTIRDSANTPPTVDAGANQTVTEGATVSLDGTASDDDTEDTLAYRWTHNSSLTITLADPAALDTSFTAPNVAADTPVLFTLTVSDGTASATDTVLVTIRDSANTPPTVDAGSPQTVAEGDTVTLSGTASDVDPEDSLTYAWTLNNTALGITLANPAALDTTFTAPAVSANTAVLFTLNVTDGTVHVADTVTITIADTNTAPTANAGDDQIVTEGATVSLDGTASDTDAEDTLAYRWTHNSSLTITLADPAALDTSFTAPNVAADTPVLFTLNVSDGTASSTDTVLVTIRDSANTPPTVDAGANQTVTEGATVSLDGTASDTDTEDTLTYAWTFNNTALGITLADPAALDTSFTAPNVAADTPVLFTLNVTDGAASATDTVLVTIRDSANTPPTADAGANQTVTEGDTVTLSGAASDVDPEDSLTYAWTFNNTALGITLADPAALDTSFTAPNVAADTPVLFTLNVSDGTASATDTVLVTIRDSANTPPTVDAGANQTVTEGATVSLDGTASDDDTEDTLTYAWTFNNTALGITLADPAALDTSFTAPNVAADTPVLFTLNVSDGTASATDTVLVTIRDSANTPPTADAGANQTVTEGATVSLDGTASDDDTEDTLTYAWTFNNTALGITLADPAALDTSFTAPNVAADTPVLFTLNVSDGTASATDTVLVTIRDSANTPPTADAGANQTVTEGATVSLDGTASDTDAEDTLAYRWTHNSSLTITLADPAALDTSFTAPNVAADTPVLFTLNVSDGTASATDTVLVTIRDSANTPPTVDAGASQTVTEGDTVSLDGTASDDDTEDTLTYAWTFNNTALGITLADPAALDTSFTAPNVAADTPVLFTLNVTDGAASATDTVLVTIRDSANTPPTADAGANQTVTEGDTVTLSGAASDVDPEDSLTYAWTFNNTALGITLADPAALDTTFTAPAVSANTAVLFTLNVTDGTVHVADTVTITIADTNTAPTANAGDDQIVTEGATVSLNGTLSSDAEDTALSYSWAHTSGPTVTLTGSATATPSFTAPNVGETRDIVLTLTVTDSGSLTDTANVTITVQNVPENDFVTTWETASASATVTIPVGGSTAAYLIDWGDGTIENVSGDQTHTYADAGFHTIRISGDFERIYLAGGSSTNAAKLKSIDQWGSIEWGSMAGAFQHATEMTYVATDMPDLSGVTDMSAMFRNAQSFNGDISSWDVSRVTDMSGMFANARVFNQPLNSWNVSQVTDMSSMFSNARSFNVDISSWDVSRVTDMSGMFASARAFNQPLNNWNVSQVTTMSSMFEDTPFDLDISDWNVSRVTDMSHMFDRAFIFDQNISNWDVSRVTNMSRMFENTSFDLDISNWNVSRVTDMSYMFSSAFYFNQDISNWNVSRVTDMSHMLDGAFYFDQNLGNWYITLDSAVIDAYDAPGAVAR